MSVSFNSGDNRIGCGTSDGLLPYNAAITICAWIFPTSDTSNGGDPKIIDRDNNVTGIVFFGMSQTNKIYFFVNGVAALNRISATNSVTLNTWQHVAVTWDGSNTSTNILMYVNGTQVSYASNGTNGSALITNTGSTTYIGNEADFVRPFIGRIDEVAVYNAVLSSTTINSLGVARVKGLPLRISTANLVSYWPLDDVSNGSSGNGVTFRDRWGTNTGTGSNGTSGTGCTGTAFQSISYLLANDKSRGVARGVFRL